MDRITLAGMRFEGRLGASDEEQAYPQLFEVDVEVETDLAEASRTDVLADTVDYAPLVELTGRLVEGSDHRLIEALAGAIGDGALALDPRISAVVVRVRKLAVPMDVDMDHAQVELRRERRSG